MWASSKPSQRCVSGNQALYVASLAQNRIRSQCNPVGNAPQFGTLLRQADGVEHTLGQHVVRFGVDADRAHLAAPPDGPRRGRPAQWVRLPTTPSGQRGSPLSPLRIGDGGTPSSPSAWRAQVPHGDEFVAPLGHRLSRSTVSSSGSGASFRWIVIHFGGRQNRARHRAAHRRAASRRSS